MRQSFDAQKEKHPSELVYSLVNSGLETAAKNQGLSLGELLEVPVGRTRRNKHDDMTVVYVSLAGQSA